jgi:hypothetical protein
MLLFADRAERDLQDAGTWLRGPAKRPVPGGVRRPAEELGVLRGDRQVGAGAIHRHHPQPPTAVMVGGRAFGAALQFCNAIIN